MSVDRSAELLELMAERILVLDGATGTMFQGKDLRAQDFGGEALEGCNEHLVMTRPDVVVDVHRAYLEAGADIIETNTFGGTRVVLAEYRLGDRAFELNRRAAELAREAVAAFSPTGRPCFVAGSIGPTTRAISVTGGISFDELVDAFLEQARGLLEGGVDLFLVETCQDTRNTKAAVIAIQRALQELGTRRPIALSGTIEQTGTMLAGQSAEAFVASMAHVDGLIAIGLNCATGPDLMTGHLRAIHEMAPWAVSCYPNAGLPDEEGHYRESPQSLAQALERFVDNGWINVIGGCCGTTEHHIAAIADMARGKRPRRLPRTTRPRTFFSGIDLVEATPENRPLLVGERTNVIGSRAFRKMITQGQWEEASEIARRQVRSGAQIIDVCLQSADGDELEAVGAFYERLMRKVRVPIMIDSTDPAAIEAALTYCQGKAIVNSINLEEGEQRFAAVCPLVTSYGAAVVVGTIDEDPAQAQAFTRERKLEVARRSHALLTTRYGIKEEDIILDPLTFPVASGDESYIGGAVETIEALRELKRELPACKTILGVSNVSFGLPPAAREIVNSVFLYLCTQAGLDLAIVNTEGLERFASIAPEERQMALDLLLNRAPDEIGETAENAELLRAAPADWREQSPQQRVAINQLNIQRIADRFRESRRQRIVREVELPLDERLARSIVEGCQEGLAADLELKLGDGCAPLDIINGPLMRGMSEVGRLFNANQLIVAEVLQSAEAMKAAVSFLEPGMKPGDSAGRGAFVLATVKGDVHDIGKNLVEIILKNNGYRVINLGIKVGPEALAAAVKEHRPDAIGLSGLLVKSAHQMAVTAEDLSAAGFDVPILVGGAALSEPFVRRRIAPRYRGPVFYCSDAMQGLAVMNRLMDGAQRTELIAEVAPAEQEAGKDRSAALRRGGPRSTRIRSDLPPVRCPSVEREVRLGLPNLREIWGYINPQMLYAKHLGLKGSFAKKLAEGDPKALALHELMTSVQAEAVNWMQVNAVWSFFEAESEQGRLSLYRGGKGVLTYEPPRQSSDDGLSLADFVLPSAGGQRDSVALFVVTAGEGVRERAELAKANGEYLRSHAIQALAIESAEAAAEWLHRQLRELWGFPDRPEMSMHDLFAARYRGKRFSPGYPACPDLEDQRVIWSLLQPDEIGATLTDGMMMDPEASVSAIVFHHPDAVYFSVAGGGRSGQGVDGVRQR